MTYFKTKYLLKLIVTLAISFLIGCDKEDAKVSEECVNEDFFTEFTSRNFKMGFSTWSFGPNEQDKDDTYQFISENSDIYSEQIDDKIPWNSLINNQPLPDEFINEISFRVSKRVSNTQLLLSVSLLNTDRDNLLEDFDGSIPNYFSLSDKVIEDAYFKHVKYLIEQFQPDYLVVAMEVNDLKLKSESKWSEYKILIQNVKVRIKQEYPSVKISESITLHNLYNPEVSNPTEYINEIVNYLNQMDFVAISFYPFFKGQHNRIEFQQAFDFLHSVINKPIAFVETTHIAENLSIPAFDLFIEGDECEQNAYLEILLANAQKENYEFVIWWAYKDFDSLWQTFPDEVKDVGKLWRDTGLIDENGNERKGYLTWRKAFNK